MANTSRTVELDQACPRCGGKLAMRQVGITVAEQAEPVRWADDRRFCPSGCALTVADFPDEQSSG